MTQSISAERGGDVEFLSRVAHSITRHATSGAAVKVLKDKQV